MTFRIANLLPSLSGFSGFLPPIGPAAVTPSSSFINSPQIQATATEPSLLKSLIEIPHGIVQTDFPDLPLIPEFANAAYPFALGAATVYGIFLVSGLIHELGHHLALRALGYKSGFISISPNGNGWSQLNSYEEMNRIESRPWDKLVWTAGGPAAGLTAGLAAFGTWYGFLTESPPLIQGSVLVYALISVIGDGLGQLIPMPEYDGNGILNSMRNIWSARKPLSHSFF